MFQSTAGPMTGCNAMAAFRIQYLKEFQSTAGPMTGCNVVRRDLVIELHVSIHSRPDDRLQRCWGGPLMAGSQMFQSTAGPMTGCNVELQAIAQMWWCFNPQPAR